ncbi:TPA: aerolysin family beta-barrel pore-forming toxin [Vibrio vulnificus]|uniref:aerolysin family beta-barrel pore-forming toxin n=1 Tax=Vibrio vulnificus TaxID=672 RepID=UPI001419143B|nr:aerolysin family beta-barrel pore-forming toxin [Vibrio vulnificus]MBN8140356.1 aerolysin family beta-barrel pore-forming toxin [Vibrio vulnificus]MBN8149670.1 aerolysin family beta-barrel pore-forming toxin [Vibrio vulnificus]NIG91917.1 aerolysin family beta-barrel pore-forming toxin [Vibrio vulnificus]HDY7439651.1 aerolysin family beta-barrel pore-forming toxin [Vibrio vulnificus]HDY7457509.1 aerolysin family beta-barrel pore-forming toxin [Vibrio vulnificus]
MRLSSNIAIKTMPLYIGVFLLAGEANAGMPKSLKLVNSSTCESGWRHPETFMVKDNKGEMLDKMGKWQIVKIGDGNVIMGWGYGGEIKASTAGSSWCIRNGDSPTYYSPSDTVIIDRTQLRTVESTFDGQCGPIKDGLRPVTYSEANLYLPSIVQQVPNNYVGAIRDGWAVFGKDYNGGKGKVEKRQDVGRSLCYPISPRENNNLTPKPGWSVGKGTLDEVTWSIATDKENFLGPWRFFQYLLGFAHVRSGDTDNFDDDLIVFRTADGGLQVRANNRDNTEKSELKIKNFEFVIDADTFKHGTVSETGKQKIKTLHTTAYNSTNVEQTAVVTLTVNEGTSWSKSETYGLGEKLTINKTWQIPQVSSFSVTAEISANQSWTSQNGGSESTSSQIQARVTLPPRSQVPVTISIYKTDVSFPYSFKAKAIYDVYMWGNLVPAYNSSVTNPNGGWIERYFPIGHYVNKDMDINEIWRNRNIPGSNRLWDFNQAVNLWGFYPTKEWLEKLLAPVYTEVVGNMSYSNQSAGSIVIGEPTKITSTSTRSSGNVTIDSVDGLPASIQIVE